MLKLIIKDSSGFEGAILYDESTENLNVSHPKREVRDSVREYLKSPRQFYEADGNMVGSRQVIIVEPIRSNIYMYKALVEMKHAIGVSPMWDDVDNSLPDVYSPYQEDGDPSLGDPGINMAKSLNTGEVYDILNRKEDV